MKKEALFSEPGNKGSVHCRLCAHQCRILPNAFGVRMNNGGILYSMNYGDVIAEHIDPIEKKPLYHLYPASQAFSVATVGCNFRCDFCQNWQISQQDYRNVTGYGRYRSPAEIVAAAQDAQARSIAYTYTEPTIYFEYAYDIARLAREAGIVNIFVTNGYMTGDALTTIAPFLDAANIDLKSFSEGFYRDHCAAKLAPVLDTIVAMKKHEIWVELTTLLIPGENDSDRELRELASWIAAIDVNMPWHISRFHPQYKIHTAATPLDTLKRAYAAGKEAGLRYVYLGNVAEGSDTCCPECNAVLIERTFYQTALTGLADGLCGKCGTRIAGIWERSIQ